MFYGTTGKGTAQHFGGELLNQTMKIELVHVPYKGMQQVLTDVLAGRLQAAIAVLATAQPHMQSGRLRALAVLESTRAPAAPDVPTVAEAGIPSYIMPDTWIGFLGPAGLPRAIVTRIHAEVVKAAEAPDVRTHFQNMGFSLILNSPEEMAAAIGQSAQIYRKIATNANIQPE